MRMGSVPFPFSFPFPLRSAFACRLWRALGPCRVNLESFVECTDVRWSEPSSECKRRIRLRHVATRFDLVAIWVRVN